MIKRFFQEHKGISFVFLFHGETQRHYSADLDAWYKVYSFQKGDQFFSLNRTLTNCFLSPHYDYTVLKVVNSVACLIGPYMQMGMFSSPSCLNPCISYKYMCIYIFKRRLTHDSFYSFMFLAARTHQGSL